MKLVTLALLLFLLAATTAIAKPRRPFSTKHAILYRSFSVPGMDLPHRQCRSNTTDCWVWADYWDCVFVGTKLTSCIWVPSRFYYEPIKIVPLSLSRNHSSQLARIK